MGRTTVVANGRGNVNIGVDRSRITVNHPAPPWPALNTLTVNYSTYVLDSTGLAVGIDPNWENLNLLTNNAGALTITGNTTTTASVFKTAGSANWDTHVYTSTGYTAPVTLEFNKQAASGDNGASYAMIGWNADPTTNASYDTLDHAAYPYRTDIYSVHHNGSQVHFSGSWSTSSKFYVTYGTDGFIRHYNGTTLLYSVNYGTGQTVYLDSSYYSVHGTFGGFSNIRITKRAYNGTSYVGGSNASGPIGLSEPGTVTTSYNTNLPVTLPPFSARVSVPISRGSYYGEPIDNRRTIFSLQGVVPYDSVELKKRDITISASQVTAIRTIDSNVAVGGGGTTTILDKQVWY